MRNNFNLKTLFSLLIAIGFGYNCIAQVDQAVNNNITDDNAGERCGTMQAVSQRVANDPAYASFYNQHIANMESGLYRSVDPCATPITIPVAFHFDASFSCADPDCLTSEVQESIDALNASFGDNTQTQLVQDLSMITDANGDSCYPLSDVSTGTCITFCLAEPRAASSNQGLDAACDPAITIGSFCGGVNYGIQVDPACDGGAPPYYSGILNVFVVADNGSGTLGIADGIPVAAANGNGVTVLGEVFGADGGGCISGGSINTSNQFGGGATLAHEIGHYLGLFHIWADDSGGCTFDDGISDTPQQGDNNGGLFPCPNVTPGTTTCAGLPMSCGSNDYYHNFMDYTSDNCLVMFTQEQAQVMNFNANELFGNTSAVCYPDPIVLTSLCEQTVCDPACDFEAVITAMCDTDSMNYTVTVEIIGGTGPFDVNETVDNDPLNVETVLATGLTAGTYTYSFPVGTNANVVVVDNGIADCFDGQLLFDPCASCDFEIEVDYSNVTCDFNANAGATGPTITFTVTNPSGIVWLDQDGNSTFDAGDFELNPTLGLTFFPNSVTNTFTFYDGGVQNCFIDVEVLLSNYSCDGVADGAPALLNCNFKAEADLVDYSCNGDGTATVTINVDNTFGTVTELSGNAVADPANPAVYTATVDVGANCGLTTLTFADDGSDVSSNSGVEITAPSNIANDIENVAYNGTDWGVDINTVTTPVCGVIAQPADGTSPETDFCEPTPPATPTAAQCANIAGNIAIIDRGNCNFTDKVENAQACGAIAVIVCNCLPGTTGCSATDVDQVITMGGTPIGTVTIPSVFLSYNDCQEVYAQLGQGTPVEFCIGAPMDVPCERTVNIDACALVCDDICSAAASTISTTDPTRICIDGVGDPINVTVDVDGGATGAWVITDAAGIILALPAGPPFDLDGAGAGQCLIWSPLHQLLVMMQEL